MAKHFTHPETWGLAGYLLLVLAGSIVLSFYVSLTGALLGFILVAAAVVFWQKPEWGIYALFFLAPMSGLIIDFSREPTLARLPYLGAINAPAVDFAAILLVACAAGLFFARSQKINFRALKNHAIFFALWFAAGAAAFYFGDPVFWGISLKALVRPYIFTYVAFVAPLLLFVRSEKILWRALFAYELAAIVGALIGIISLFTQPIVGFLRVEPLVIFGFAPFGNNHNILAESLVAIIPFAWWFAWQEEEKIRRRWLMVAAGLITTVSLLTFSRAAWVVVCLQLLVWFVWHTRRQESWQGASLTRKKISFVAVAAAAVLAVIFFTWISTTVIAERSDATRADLTGIAWTYFQRAPLTGQGPGTFLPLVDETFAFRQDYGEALDAHGWLQKFGLETGIFGLLTFALLLGALFYKLWQRRREEKIFVLSLTLLSVWVFQLFNTGYFLGKTWVLVGAALVILIL